MIHIFPQDFVEFQLFIVLFLLKVYLNAEHLIIDTFSFISGGCIINLTGDGKCRFVYKAFVIMSCI